MDDDIKTKAAYQTGIKRVEEAICHKRSVSSWYRSHRAVQRRVSPNRGTNTSWSGKAHGSGSGDWFDGWLCARKHRCRFDFASVK